MELKGKHIGVIAGAGDLPHAVITAAREAGAKPYVIAINGTSAAEDFPVDGVTLGIAEFGKMTKAFVKQHCQHVVMVGYVKRPDFKQLKPDMKAMKYISRAVKAAAKGDDALLSFIVSVFEKEGFTIISPQEICQHLLIPEGPLGKIAPGDQHQDDITRAMDIAAAIGKQDIGQGAVVCNGLVLAVEAQEGTDTMLSRIPELEQDIRGRVSARRGVLAKRVKPGQEERVDLPTIGPSTIKLAADAGLAGVVLEAGRAFVMERDQVIRTADHHGLFIIGVENG